MEKNDDRTVVAQKNPITSMLKRVVNIIGALVAKVATNHFAMDLIRERSSHHIISMLPKMKRYISVAANILAINRSATVRTTISKFLLGRAPHCPMSVPNGYAGLSEKRLSC